MPFIITAVLAGLFTYILMFNLDNLIYVSGNIYKPIRAKYIRRMEKDEAAFDKTSIWNQRGAKLNQTLQKVEYTRPSEWWLLLYLPRYIIRRISAVTPNMRGIRRGRRNDSKGAEDDDAEKGL